MSRKRDVITRREYDDGAKDDNTPVHGGRLNGRRQREEAEHEDRRKEAQRCDVDGHAKFTERPAAVGERFTANAFDEDAADCDAVGGDEGGDGEGDDCLEGDGGADVDEREEDGHDEGDDNGVEGDVPAWGYLKEGVRLVWMIGWLWGFWGAYV